MDKQKILKSALNKVKGQKKILVLWTDSLLKKMRLLLKQLNCNWQKNLIMKVMDMRMAKWFMTYGFAHAAELHMKLNMTISNTALNAGS